MTINPYKLPSKDKLTPAELRVETAERLWRVLYRKTSESLDTVLQPALDNAEQQAWMSAALYGSLRYYLRYQAQLKRYLKTPIKPKEGEVIALFILGMHQLSAMRVKEHAAINETVNACKLLQKEWAVNLLNGVLRNYQRDLVDQKFKNEVETYAHPKWMLNMLKKDRPKQWRDILEANNQQAPMSLRVNLTKLSRDEALDQLNKNGINAHAHADVASAVILESACDVNVLPGFSEGNFSVQDVAAQMSAEILISEQDTSEELIVLDACAAPGGKTVHLLERLSNQSHLTAIDVSEYRLQRVHENIQRAGFAQRENLEIRTQDATELSPKENQKYDRILLDAPCTASGVIRRHPDIKIRRSLDKLNEACALQAQIMKVLWQALKPGGRMLYATCSIFAMENEEQIKNFLHAHDDAKVIPLDIAKAENSALGSQILPGSMERDGFFYALLQKN